MYSSAIFLSATFNLHFAPDSNLVKLACEPGGYRFNRMQAPILRSEKAIAHLDAMPDSQLRNTDTVRFYAELLLLALSDHDGPLFLQPQVSIDIVWSVQCFAMIQICR
jgi:hypothetical protein